MKSKHILLCLLLFVATASQAQTRIIVGDMNRDGEINVSDVTALVSVILGNSPIEYITRDDFGTPVTGITLNHTSLRLKPDGTATLTATVTPDDAALKDVTWTSSDAAVATVSEAGVVTAVGEGTAIITATTVDCGLTATCTVKVSLEPEYVEMAPGFLWGTCNVGADNPWDYGDYFAWGETQPKADYSWSNYVYGTSSNLTKYNASDGKTVLQDVDDAAIANIGEYWRTPTMEEWDRLLDTDNYSWTWVSDYNSSGVNGFIVTSNVQGCQGNQIFLPAAGDHSGSNFSNAGSGGSYWSSSVKTSFPSSAYGVFFFESDDDAILSTSYRNYGYSVRAVYDKKLINGHKYVEMGDGLKWATMNVGADNPEDYGDYFAWGETDPKTDYGWETYKHMYTSSEDYSLINKYQVDDGVLDAIWYDDGTFTGDGMTSFEDYAYEDDAARKNWGSTWRTPTDDEWAKLLDTSHFMWTWTTNYEGTGISGYVVISRVSGYIGNQIFLPAAGGRSSTYLFFDGSAGYYWSSSLSTNGTGSAFYAGFDSDNMVHAASYRCSGMPVRPVSE